MSGVAETKTAASSVLMQFCDKERALSQKRRQSRPPRLWVFEWDDMSVECGVFYCCWNDGDAPQSVCVVAVSYEYLLAVFEKLELIFSEQGEVTAVAELFNG